MSIFTKIHRAILGGEVAGSDKSGYLSRAELNDKIYQEFIQRMNLSSTPDGLLFPTNFMIYLSKGDYDLWSETFPYTVQEVVNRFHEKIREMKGRYKDYIPHAQFWQFQFSVFPEGGIVSRNGEPQRVLESHDVLILSKIHPDKDLDEIGSILEGPERVVTTLHTKNSQTVSQLAINKEALRHVDIRAKDKFRVNFAHFAKIKETPKNEQERIQAKYSAMAQLVILDGAAFITPSGEKQTVFPITSSSFYVSGKNANDTLGGIPVARLNSEKVRDPHFQISRDDSGNYSIAAWGDTVVDEKTIEPDGKHWNVLNPGEQILINGEIALVLKLAK